MYDVFIMEVTHLFEQLSANAQLTLKIALGIGGLILVGIFELQRRKLRAMEP